MILDRKENGIIIRCRKEERLEGEHIMIDSVDFAKYIVITAKKENALLNQTQLQKILYICDGTLLAFGENMIGENARVWEHGPVYPKVYKWYSKHRYPEPKETDIRKESLAVMQSENIKSVITQAVRKFSKWASVQLSEWSHKQGSPWDIALRNSGMYSVINKDDMRSYFKEMLDV